MLHARGGVYQPLILRWDGLAWTIVFAPTNLNGDSMLFGVKAVTPDDVWAVGKQPGARSLAYHWDGVAWSSVASPIKGASLRAIDGLGSNDLWSVGSFGTGAIVQHWDGAAWQASLATNTPGEFDAIVEISPSDVWAMGSQPDASAGAARVLVEHWDGTAWAQIPAPDPGRGDDMLNGAGMATTPRLTLWATGFFTGSTSQALAERMCP